MNTLDTSSPLSQTSITEFPLWRRGKVRDVYDLGDALAIVATDRISAFDYVLQPGIPNKGRLLTAMTLFWLKWLSVTAKTTFSWCWTEPVGTELGN